MLIAHREIDGNGYVHEQALEEHLYATGNRAGEIGKGVGIEAFMKVAGYLHDCGKAERSFQEYIRGNSKLQINHSSAGGRILLDLIPSDPDLKDLQKRKLKFQYFQEILIYIILAHHGLYDLITYGSTEYKTSQRLNYDDTGKYHYREDVMFFVQKVDLELTESGNKSIKLLIKDAYYEFELIYSKLKGLSEKITSKEKRKEAKEYYISCFTRLCLSILKEADIYDSANAFHNPKQRIWSSEERIQIWETANERVEEMYHMFENHPNSSDINKLRNDIAASAKKAAVNTGNGNFQLDLPTGAGKTKTGLRYALTNAKEYKRDRVFYITAFLSVLEQNAADIRDILAMEEVVLEHHSNVINDEDKIFEGRENDGDYDHVTYLRDSWENPIILTTMVQFFNTLYKEKSSNIRRFCKLINSVIILDEIQSLPLKVISNFNLMMNFMKEIMRCNIVHCTATQPVLDSKAIPYPIHYGDEIGERTQIVHLGTVEKECFQRVKFYNLTGKDARTLLSTEELFFHIQEQLQVFDSCLVVLNTKKAVQKLFDYIEEEAPDSIVYYLTTNLCAAHRLNIISALKRILLQNRKANTHHKVICISTQLVEAGVDLDFDVVFRSLAGLDSLVQCAGRCNREGKLQIDGKKTHGKLYIMRYMEENLSSLPDIKASVVASEYSIRSIQEEASDEDNQMDIEKLQTPYFEKYYVSNLDKLDYSDIRRHSNMIEELGSNMQDRSSYFMAHPIDGKPVMFQAFRTAAENFHLIDEGTTTVIVPYQNEELLGELEIAMDKNNYSELKSLLQMLQRYSINIYLSEKYKPFLMKYEGISVYILLKEYYNERKGILITELADLIL